MAEEQVPLLGEKLPEIVFSDYKQSMEMELKYAVDELKAKMNDDKKRCKHMLNQASEVEAEGESSYKTLFGMVVKDCVDTILKKEVMYLTVEMSRFRRNFSRRLVQDESLTFKSPLNLSRLPEGFQEAWKTWIQDDRDTREELSYKAAAASSELKRNTQ